MSSRASSVADKIDKAPSTPATLSSVTYNYNHELKSNWIPLPQIARGVSVGNYYPTTQPLTPSPFTGFDLGDIVYIFEVDSSGKRYRGYVVSLPFSRAALNILAKDISPAVYSTQSSQKSAFELSRRNLRNNKNIIVQNCQLDISIGIFPVELISVKEYYNSDSAVGPKPKLTSIPAPGSSHFHDNEKPAPPALPHLRLEYNVFTVKSEPIVDDIIAVIGEWYSAYINSSFLLGDTNVVNILAQSVQGLDLIRKQMIYGLFTSSERDMARKRAIWHICRASKVLNRGIIARDPETGDVMPCLGGEVRMAQEQMLLALSPNYPMHRPEIRIQSYPSLPKHVMVSFVSMLGQGYPHSIYILLYLRTRFKRVTESLKIKVDPGTIVKDQPPVIFCDLPPSIVKSDVYLLAEICYEQTLNSSAQRSLPERRGLVVGVTDITRLFKVQGNSEAPFRIKLFTNNHDEMDVSEENKGWGELASGIIFGNPSGL